MESFSVRTTLNLADWNALVLESGSRVAGAQQETGSWLARQAPHALWLLLVLIYIWMLNTEPPLIRPAGIAIATAGFFGVWWLQWLIQRRAYNPREAGAFLGEQEFVFERGGFRSRRANHDAFNRWSLVTDITRTEDHVFVWIDKHSGYTVPARDLPAPMTAASAVARLKEFVAAAAAEPMVDTQVAAPAAPDEIAVVPSSEAAPIDAPPALPTIAQELFAVMRLHAWGVVDGARLYGRDVTLLLLGVLSLGLWIGLDRLDYEGDVAFFIYGLAENAAVVVAVLAIAWLLSRASRPRIEMRQSLLLVLGFLPIFVALLHVVWWLPKLVFILAFVLACAWCERFLGAGLRSLTGRRQPWAVTATLLGGCAVVYLSFSVYFSPGFWTERDEDSERAAETLRQNEQIVFEQSARINAVVSSLAPRAEGQTNVFFVGFAGYGGQKVFAEEIGLAAKQIGSRYDAARRSVLLVNDRRDSLKYPVASVPSLRHTLNALSQRMNVEEDILILALSSHGSEDGTVSVSSELGYWRDLSADDLAQMLREAGIRWRVIVVSACYSGTFVEPLRDEYTIIITAAAEDRTSFGCSDDNDLTYFGEAFYRDALPMATGLRAAYQAASAAIAERETREGMKQSNPQANFGSAIEKKLSSLEAARSN